MCEHGDGGSVCVRQGVGNDCCLLVEYSCSAGK